MAALSAAALFCKEKQADKNKYGGYKATLSAALQSQCFHGFLRCDKGDIPAQGKLCRRDRRFYKARMAAPFGEIYKLPELLEKFSNLYVNILTELEAPVQAAIDEARERVFDELNRKHCHEKLSDKFVNLFNEIREKAEHCNNVAQLQNIKVEADALKIRCLNEISAEEAKLIEQETGAGPIPAGLDNIDNVALRFTDTINNSKQDIEDALLSFLSKH